MDDTFDYFFLPIPDDRFLHVTGDSCPRMDQVEHAILIDPQTIEMDYDFLTFFSMSYFDRLRDLTDMPDANDYVLQDVNNYLYWAEWSDLDLRFDINDEDNDYMNVMMNISKYKGRIASDELW